MLGLLWTYANALSLPEPMFGPFGPTGIHRTLASAAAYDEKTTIAQTAIITALKRITNSSRIAVGGRLHRPSRKSM
jgi:hypothetical protein